MVLAASGSSTSSPAREAEQPSVPSQWATTGPSNYAKAKGFFEVEGPEVTVQPIQVGVVEAAL